MNKQWTNIKAGFEHTTFGFQGRHDDHLTTKWGWEKINLFFATNYSTRIQTNICKICTFWKKKKHFWSSASIDDKVRKCFVFSKNGGFFSKAKEWIDDCFTFRLFNTRLKTMSNKLRNHQSPWLYFNWNSWASPNLASLPPRDGKI